jgi:hypothetical protein
MKPPIKSVQYFRRSTEENMMIIDRWKVRKKEFYEEVEVVGVFLYIISIKLSFQLVAGFSKKLSKN